MTETLRALTSKLLAVAILFAAAYGVMTLAVGPLAAQHADLLDGIQTQRSLLGRLTAAAAQETAASTKGRLPDGASKGPIFLEGESEQVLRASNLGQPVTLTNPLSAPARAYNDAARRLMGDNLAINVPLERFNLLGRIFGGRAA